MLEQLKAKSFEAAAIASTKAGNLKDVTQAATKNIKTSEALKSLKQVTQKGTESIQSTAASFNISIPSLSTIEKNETNKEIPMKQQKNEKIISKSLTEIDLEKNEIKNTPKNQEQEGLLDELAQECQLSKRQRLYGAIGCYAIGSLCGFLSTMMLWGGPKHIKQFAFFYTTGTLCSIGSSLFLVGPYRQLKVMCMPIRRVACCIWIGAMMLTLIVAFGYPKLIALVLPLVIVQYVAMLWYGASYIPYGRAMLRKCCSKAAQTATSI